MKWPTTIPEDLRKRLDGTLGMRYVDAAVLWGDVLEWLKKHDVQPPGHPLPEAERSAPPQDE